MSREYKGFTLAEIMITVFVIGVIASITIPVLKNGTLVDKDVQTYRKALFTVQRATELFMESPRYSRTVVGHEEEFLMAFDNNKGKIPNNYTSICEGIASQINTKGAVRCDITDSSRTKPNFTTSDGLVYYGFEKLNEANLKNGAEVTVRADRAKLSSGDIGRRENNAKAGLRININNRGKISTHKDFGYELALIKDYSKANVKK